MVTRTTAELNDLGVPPARWHEVITAASLIQAEAGRTEDMAKISQVLHNRIAAKRPLQLDTTVNYALKQRKVKVAESQTKIKSPYNTYNAPGLPIGAIGSPGADAIKAWLNPAPGPWLYFVAVDPDSGETKFGTTEAEFWAMQKELNAWMKAHPDR